MKNNNKQQELFLNIINKKENWENDYDQLFLVLINFANKIISKYSDWKKLLYLENDDFLTSCFKEYTNLIKSFILNKNDDYNLFLKKYGYKIKNLCCDARKHFLNNKHKILNESNSLDALKFEDLNLTNNTLYYDLQKEQIEQNFIEESLKNNPILLKVINLKKENFTNNEICKMLNINLSFLYRLINSFKKVIHV